MPMTLLDYLNASGETANEFADRIIEARTTIRKIVYRTRQPSLQLAVKIVDATGGKVAHVDLIAERVA